jgi:hypothetical protein
LAKAGHQLLSVLLLALAPTLSAGSNGALAQNPGLEGAQAAYMQGLAQERSKNYVGALEFYKSALVAYPSYVYADRELANCYDYLGDTEDASRECGIYLAVKPHDALVRAFAERLARGNAAPQGAVTALLPAAAEAQPFQQTLYAGISVGWVLSDNSDVQRLSPGSDLTDPSGVMESFRLGLLTDAGFWLEGAFSAGPDRDYSLAGPGSGDPAGLELTENTLSLEPGFRFPLGAHVTLGGGVAIGISSAELVYSPQSGAVQSYTGSGFVYTPEVKISLVFGGLGLDIDAGFHNSQISPLKDSNGFPLIVADLATGSPENWTMENSGYFIRLGVVYYLKPPMAPSAALP